MPERGTADVAAEQGRKALLHQPAQGAQHGHAAVGELWVGASENEGGHSSGPPTARADGDAGGDAPASRNRLASLSWGGWGVRSEGERGEVRQEEA